MAYRALIIPTYTHHFSCNEKFLESFSQFCVDPENVDINFILSDNDINKFMEISNKFNHLQIRLWTLKEILQKNDISVDEGELLSRIGKFNYQSIKKIYACYTLGYEETIVLDSENVFVRPFEIKSIFDKVSKNKIIYTDDNIPLDIQKDVTRNCAKILGGTDYNLWMFNTSFWFFERQAVRDLMEYVLETNNRSLFDILCDPGFSPLFEAVLYNWFVHKFDYGYSFVSLNKIMKEVFKDKFEYVQDKVSKFIAAFEYVCVALDESTKVELTEFINKYEVDIMSFSFSSPELTQYCIDNSNVKCKTYFY